MNFITKMAGISFFLIGSAMASHGPYECVLKNVPLDQSPMVRVEAPYPGSDHLTWKLEVFKSSEDWDLLFETSVNDLSEDVAVYFENESKGVSLSFYADESDSMGFMDGNIKSPVMNGEVKCLREDY